MVRKRNKTGNGNNKGSVTNGGGSRRRAPRNNNNNGKRVNGGNGNAAKVPLMPSGVNNSATMPRGVQSYSYDAEEVIQIINVPSGSVPGQKIFNARIGPKSVLRLGLLSDAWMRIDWRSVRFHMVTLNGSLVTSGYTMGFIEDPHISPPADGSAVIPFLTALRQTTVRQNWVESQSGCTVGIKDLPEMYTQLGSDERRYYIGRLVAAVTGDVGESPTSFQLMMKYKVTLYVPMAMITSGPDPPVPGETWTMTADAQTSIDEDEDIPYLSVAQNIPALGVYRLKGNTTLQLYRGPSASPTSSILVRGFRVINAIGAGEDWGSNTEALLSDGSYSAWPVGDGVDVTCWSTTLGEGGPGVPQVPFRSGTVFDKIV